MESRDESRDEYLYPTIQFYRDLAERGSFGEDKLIDPKVARTDDAILDGLYSLLWIEPD